jgi:four helix bundle protein
VGPHFVTPRGYLRLRRVFPSDACAARSEGISARNIRLKIRRLMVHILQSPVAVPLREWVLRERAERFARTTAAICEELPEDPTARKLGRQVSEAATAVYIGYRAACVSKSPEQFVVNISVVARHAKRVRRMLLALVQANHLSIETARELILEARGLEAIFTASRNTAKRRKAARQRPSTT